MNEFSVCDTKVYFDTEFEAEISAAKVEAKHGGEFIPYRCGSHWHLTHKNLLERRGAGHKYWRCPKCKKIVKRGQRDKHEC